MASKSLNVRVRDVSQVHAHGVVLLSGSTRVQDLPLQDLIGLSSTSIVAACVADPYLLLHLSSGNALLLYADASHGGPCHCYSLHPTFNQFSLSLPPHLVPGLACLIGDIDAAGQLAVAPHSAKLSQGAEGITACTLHRDASRTFAAKGVSEDGGANVVCVVCRSARLEILSLPALDVLLSIKDISDGQLVVPGNPPAGKLCNLIFCLDGVEQRKGAWNRVAPLLDSFGQCCRETRRDEAAKCGGVEAGMLSSPAEWHRGCARPTLSAAAPRGWRIVGVQSLH